MYGSPCLWCNRAVYDASGVRVWGHHACGVMEQCMGHYACGIREQKAYHVWGRHAFEVPMLVL